MTLLDERGGFSSYSCLKSPGPGTNSFPSNFALKMIRKRLLTGYAEKCFLIEFEINQVNLKNVENDFLFLHNGFQTHQIHSNQFKSFENCAVNQTEIVLMTC